MGRGIGNCQVYNSKEELIKIFDTKVPEKLKNFYQARRLLSELYSSSEFELKFKLQPGDIMMFDNHRLLHGRTAYNANEGMRHLQGCYLEFDATDGKLRHLARKFQ